MSVEELETALTAEFETRAQKFIGKSCNFVNAKLLESSLNQVLSRYVNDREILSDSVAKINFNLTDYDLKKFVYSVDLVTLSPTERVEVNLVFEANI